MAESVGNKPSFVPYEKMTESTNEWVGQRLDGIKEWVALEKIHGANFSFTVVCLSTSGHRLETSTDKQQRAEVPQDTPPLSVFVARRGDYLKEGENFFGLTAQREFLELEKENAKCVCASVIQRMDNGSDKIESVTIYGELFGGLSVHAHYGIPYTSVRGSRSSSLSHLIKKFDISWP